MSKQDDEHYQLLIIRGGVEPELYGPIAETWEGFEKILFDFLKNQEYDHVEDGLFFVRLSKGNRLRNVGSFSNGYMDDMMKKARGEGVAS